MRFIALGLFLLAGCASGPHYWTKPGATSESFLADHTPCFKDATIGYGVGSEKAYKACMTQKGWTRIQVRGSQPPDADRAAADSSKEEMALASHL
jgi:hypothetical protein